MPTQKRPQTAKKSKLTHKENGFVEAYLANGGNGTDAAKQVGYSEKSARELARRLLTKVDIQARIKERLNEAKVTSDEVIGTLAAQMRAKITDVLPDDGGLISEIKKKNLGHLIRKIKVRREIDPDSKKAFEVAEIEIHSSQAAAVQLAKILGIEQEPRSNEHDGKESFERAIECFIEETGQSRKEAERYLVKAQPLWARYVN